MAQSQGRECADCLGNRRLERRLSLRRAKKHAFHGRGKLLLVGALFGPAGTNLALTVTVAVHQQLSTWALSSRRR